MILLYSIYRFSTQNYIHFKISTSGFLKYSQNFENFTLDILIKYILIKKSVRKQGKGAMNRKYERSD